MTTCLGPVPCLHITRLHGVALVGGRLVNGLDDILPGLEPSAIERPRLAATPTLGRIPPRPTSRSRSTGDTPVREPK